MCMLVVSTEIAFININAQDASVKVLVWFWIIDET
jgi:hypothetical protein